MTKSFQTYVDFLGEAVPHDGRSPITWRVSAYGIVVRDGTILLVEPAWASRWELPGGGVGLEIQADGATRECWEETGYRFTPSAEGPQFVAKSLFLLRSPIRSCHLPMFTVRGIITSHPDPTWRRDPAEINAVRWVSPESLTPDNVHQPHWIALRNLQLV